MNIQITYSITIGICEAPSTAIVQGIQRIAQAIAICIWNARAVADSTNIFRSDAVIDVVTHSITIRILSAGSATVKKGIQIIALRQILLRGIRIVIARAGIGTTGYFKFVTDSISVRVIDASPIA
tara:strand:+ start:235 stop:609 length:375 start_codon:yes stop_codon:yes gene_type:complete